MTASTRHRILITVHRWTGIIAAALVIVAGLTGSAITFRAELDHWLNPDVLVVDSGTVRLPLDALATKVEAAFPGGMVTGITLARDPTQAWMFSLTQKPTGRAQGKAAPFSPSMVYVDPYTAAVTGTRNRNTFGIDRNSMLTTLYELHHDLFLGLPGHWIMAGAALAWIILSAIGIYLAIQHNGGFWRAFRVATGGSARRVLIDLHRSVGLISVTVVLILALSGIYLNLRQEFTGLVRLVSPVAELPDRDWPERAALAAPVGFTAALAAALAPVQDGVAHSITLNRAKGFYRVRVMRPGDINQRGDLWIYLAAEDARLLQTRDIMRGTRGEVFVAWLRPLHSGEALGMPGRIAVLITGLLPVLFAATGSYVWLNRRLSVRKAIRVRDGQAQQMAPPSSSAS